MSGRAPLSERLVDEHGWHAHERVHDVFDGFLDALTAFADRPSFEAAALAVLLQRDLAQHMEFEEEHVLPRYRERVPDPPRPARAALFERDHEILRERGARLTEGLLVRALGGGDDASVEDALVELDDTLEHHDERETEHLYPALEVALEEGERSAVLHAMGGVALRGPDAASARAGVIGRAPLLDRLAARHRAWRSAERTARERIAAAPDLTVTVDGEEGLGPKASRALPTLLARDESLAADFFARQHADARARHRHRWKVEQALRSTVRFVLDDLCARESCDVAGESRDSRNSC